MKSRYVNYAHHVRWCYPYTSPVSYIHLYRVYLSWEEYPMTVYIQTPNIVCYVAGDVPAVNMLIYALQGAYCVHVQDIRRIIIQCS